MARRLDYLDLPLGKQPEAAPEDIRPGALIRDWQAEQRTGRKNPHAPSEVRKPAPLRNGREKPARFS
jgi:hypothetical protein